MGLAWLTSKMACENGLRPPSSRTSQYLRLIAPGRRGSSELGGVPSVLCQLVPRFTAVMHGRSLTVNASELIKSLTHFQTPSFGAFLRILRNDGGLHEFALVSANN